MVRKERLFTIKEAADICRLSRTPIARCFDEGHLRGYRHPTSKARHIPRADLVRFVRENHLSPAWPTGTRPRILVGDGGNSSLIAKAVAEASDWDVRTGTDLYELGLLVEQFCPDVVVLGYGLVRELIRHRSGPPTAKVIVIAEKEPESVCPLRILADIVLTRPIVLEDLIERTIDLL